jgi:tetratricopeptide (TPR) repeat protein
VALYNRAGRAYEAEQYEEAVALYEAIAKRRIRAGRVYYNLGNAYFKAGQLGKAILSYERARRLLPRDEDIEANLGFVRLLKVDK